MKTFMSEDFLLSTPTARRLYHEVAKGLPIIDYHCHLPPADIANDIKFRNIGHLFLGGDHYKWRAMAAYGFDNEFIRTSDDYERFMAYAKAMPMMIGNPLHHWTHLELKRVFGITDILSKKTAQAVWDRTSALLATDEYSAKNLIRRFNVEVICTTDDPIDDLRHHQQLAKDQNLGFRVLPAFRPDKALKAGQQGFGDSANCPKCPALPFNRPLM